MKTLPNGVTVFNATPHDITFWRDGWEDVVIVEPDMVINAKIVEKPLSCLQVELAPEWENIWFVKTEFVGDSIGKGIISMAKDMGANVIVGSVIAAQAYPGEVVAMTPCGGYERVPPSEKRMNPDKFTIYTGENE